MRQNFLHKLAQPAAALLLSGVLFAASVGFAVPARASGVPQSMAAFVQLQSSLRQSKVLKPEAPGTTVYESRSVLVDASNAAKGYIMVKYSGSNPQIKVRVTKKDGTVFTYDLNSRSGYETFPLTEGSGSYTLNVYEHLEGTKYVQAFGQVIEVTLENEFSPFLYPNQYVMFSENSKAVQKSEELAKGAADEMAVVTAVYDFVLNNITYDTKKAATVQSGYLPDVDQVLTDKTGICFDYAALMTAMLRSQDIPTKLVVGYTGSLYHAWINVYLKKTGWVSNAIYFDGQNWKLMDPTFASGGKDDPKLKQYIGDGNNYQAKYTY